MKNLYSTAATLGVIFVYSIDQLPQQVSMQWKMFDERINRVTASATDEAGRGPEYIDIGRSGAGLEQLSDQPHDSGNPRRAATDEARDLVRSRCFDCLQPGGIGGACPNVSERSLQQD